MGVITKIFFEVAKLVGLGTFVFCWFIYTYQFLLPRPDISVGSFYELVEKLLQFSILIFVGYIFYSKEISVFWLPGKYVFGVILFLAVLFYIPYMKSTWRLFF